MNWHELCEKINPAEILFAAQVTEIQLESEIDDWHGASHDADSPSKAEDMVEGIRWDYYDCSLEIDGAKSDFRLSPEQANILHEKGFDVVYINHRDGWETYYSLPSSDPTRKTKAPTPASSSDATNTLRQTIADFDKDEE